MSEYLFKSRSKQFQTYLQDLKFSGPRITSLVDIQKVTMTEDFFYIFTVSLHLFLLLPSIINFSDCFIEDCFQNHELGETLQYLMMSIFENEECLIWSKL